MSDLLLNSNARSLGALLAITLLSATSPRAQEPPPVQSEPKAREFEVASIRPNVGPRRPPEIYNPFTFAPGGRFAATNATLLELILLAYQIRPIELEGGPSWLSSDRFDVSAKADDADGQVTQEQWGPMIRALLTNRFKLSVRHETKEVQVFALVEAKGGHRLQKSATDGRGEVAYGAPGEIKFTRMPTLTIINTLTNVLRTPVIDKTGITGSFDFTLDLRPDTWAITPGNPPPSTEMLYDATVASLDRLGLKLERQRAPRAFIIIEHAEKPSEN